MKAVSPLGGGQRGKWKAAGVVAALVLIVALVTGGCGGNAGNGNSASQLDDEAAGASGDNNSSGSPPPAGTGGGGEGNVMAGYTWNQCIADMTIRYGSDEVARQVCDSVQNDYSGSPRSELTGALQVVESSLGVTPVNPSVPGGTAGGTTTGGTTTTGGSSGSTGGNGWNGIEIIVPPSP